ncbi:Z1 domain-containing protein [Planococcus sp. FY231025]|uniref:Z1 domain-containing protein n=1 Tax=Planococcus sp. FY231025 TaxID=3455699 RepID=UPI003F8DF5B8
MSNYSQPKYDYILNMIEKMRINDRSWDQIKYGGGSKIEDLEKFIDMQKMVGAFSNDITKELWLDRVSWAKNTEEQQIQLERSSDRTIILSENADSDAEVPLNPKSSWQLYKNKLKEENWSIESINEIEKSTINLLRKLNPDTAEAEAVKGLVIGNVQSGKTANMAGLMAMAADHGWNMFIILSGLIENLRKQTEERLFSDLNHPGMFSWQALDNPSKKTPLSKHTQFLHLQSKDRERYLTVCLKHKSRLENLIKWLTADKIKHKQMKILVIEDEADQAGINTLDIESEERAKINSLIVELVNGKPNAQSKPRSMNYISYTATPYANVLNETSKESLYPKDFIGILKTPKEYFGPKEIFGLYETDDYPGLDIIRDISDIELDQLIEVHKDLSDDLPEAMKKSILWFYCAAAAQRYLKYQKPVSMLIHTSQVQNHHKKVAESIDGWLDSLSTEEFLKKCKDIYSYETQKFTLEDFRSGYPKYGVKNSDIKNYPKFDEIIEGIRELKEKRSHIELDQKGDLNYHKGVHLCIDNCANNGVNDENQFVRLAYPKKGISKLESNAPAFIVIGGSTLSRGLTIEGLVSTFFLRSTKQGDTLMQMGRWFGYRKGYELLPRIWMTEDTQNKFRFLASLEHEMREDFHPFVELGMRPEEYGPHIKNSPELSWLRITAKNRMQSAIETNLDFSGVSSQTVVFKNDKNTLENNIQVAEQFIERLGPSALTYDKSGLLWKDIEFDEIKQHFFDKFIFENSHVFDQIDGFSEWYKKVEKEEGFTGWNILVVGKGKVDENRNGWKINGHQIGKVQRTRKGKYSVEGDKVSVGVLRNPSDLYKDMSLKELERAGANFKDLKADNLSVHNIRKKAGLDKTAQLIIYRIDKDSSVRNSTGNKSERYDLEFDEDIIGVSVLVPGKRNKSLAKKLTVHLKATSEKEAEIGEEEL